MSFTPSKHQQDIFDFIKNESGNMVINAVAGSGKTTTIIKSLDYVDKNLDVLFLAFNKSIKKEIDSRLKSNGYNNVDVNTSHGYGYSTIVSNFDCEVALDNLKYKKLLNDLISSAIAEDYLILDKYELSDENKKLSERFKLSFDNPQDKEMFFNNALSLVNLIRLYVSDNEETLNEIIDKYDIVLTSEELSLAIDLLMIGQSIKRIIDFTDMVYYPTLYNLETTKYDLVYLDECFPYNTFISTEQGKIKIGQLEKRYNDGEKLPMVVSFNEQTKKFEYKNIKKVWCNGVKDVYQIVLGGKRKVKSTKNHKYLTQRGWVEMEHLKVGDAIIANNESGSMIVTKKMEFIKTEKVYDMEVEDNHNFIVTSSTPNYGNPFDEGIVAHNCQDVNTAQRLLMLKAIKENGRFVSVGDKHQCQPPETLVRKSDGTEVRIDELKIGDNVVSYNARFGKGFVGYYTSETFVKRYANISAKILDIAKHEFNGELIKITTKDDNFTSKYTPNHRCLVRYQYLDNIKYQLYVMEKDGKFRIGIMPIQSVNGFGLSVRSRQEKAQKSWVLKLYDSREEAYYNEQYYSYEFGIPQLRFIDNKTGTMRQSDMDSIWVRFDKDEMFKRVNKLLNLFGRLYEYPFWYKNSNVHSSRTGISEVRACNLIPEIMLVPCFKTKNRGNNGNIKAEFQKFDLVKEPYNGLVYSLKVSKEECYVADNILTHNSIYSFAGADSESFIKLTNLPNVKLFPLSKSYRCGKNIIKSVQHIVPHIEANESNPDGVIIKADSVDNIEVGDMVLCRNTYPLVKLCLKFISEGKKANVMGGDIGKTIITLLDQTKESDSEKAFARLYDKLNKTLEKVMLKTGLSADKAMKKAEYANMLEKIKMIETIYKQLPEGNNSVNDISNKITSIFSDSTGNGILLSTIHKAKGLESKRVYIIHPELMPSKFAEKEWELEQENNLIYVARTRAINQLSYVTDYDAYDECNSEKVDTSNIIIRDSKHIGNLGERHKLIGEIIDVKFIQNYNTNVYIVEDANGNILEHWGAIPQHFSSSKTKRIGVGTKISGTIKIVKHTSFNNINKTSFKCLKR